MSSVELKTKLKSQARLLGLVVLLMFGFAYALVPLYNRFCEMTGLQGKMANERVRYASAAVDPSRTIKVDFVTHVQSNLPWNIVPLEPSIEVHPGETVQVLFEATNLSNEAHVSQINSTALPGQVARYIKKADCFSFEQQLLDGQETTNFSLVFFIDNKIPNNIDRLTMSYTLFDVGQVEPNNLASYNIRQN